MKTKQIVEQILNRMETGWNNGDGPLFASPFAATSQFTDIRGTLHADATPPYLAGAHNGLFNSIYKNSRVKYSPVQVQDISPTLTLANVDAWLEVPSGPLAGKMESSISIVIDQSIEDGKIISFHNTPKTQ